MKIIGLFISSFIILTSGCCSGDCGDLSTTYEIENNNVINIENNQDSFNVDDIIYINTLIENNQTTTDNQNIEIAEFTYKDETSFFNYEIALFQKTNFGTFSKINLTEAAIERIEGDVEISQGGVYTTIPYDGENFKGKFGIKLLQSGEYVLAGYRFLNNDSNIDISGGVYELGYIQIRSELSNLDGEKGYRFTVN